MDTKSTVTKSTPLEIARHIVTEARRERIRLRRGPPTRHSRSPHPAAPPADTGAPMHVVVGVDGSEGSRRALMWAAREAHVHDGRLTVCWTGPSLASSAPTGQGEAGFGHDSGDRIEEELGAVIAAAAPGLQPDLRTAPVALGARAQELVELSGSADLLVVARPREWHLSRQSPATVTRRVINQARCSVLLVP